jgi:hypothetical protein
MEITSLSLTINEGRSGFNEKKIFRSILLLELGFTLLLTLFPLFFNLPFRINLFLTYEGAYRMYAGQIPYKDFGMPLGVGYFIIPLAFFYLFGPVMRSLLYAQVFINLLSIFFFRSILKKLDISPINRLLSLLVFTISYTFIFFWPWYNNTAFLYQLIGIYLILKAYSHSGIKSYLYATFAGSLTFLCFFTKQDYGGLAFLFALILTAYQSYANKNIKTGFAFLAGYAFFAALLILPFLQYDFLYWFNYGQSPHDSRLSPEDFLKEGLGNSSWEKFYLFLLFILSIDYFSNFKKFILNKNLTLLLLLAAGMIFEALITKVTSKNSLETTTYYHGFACAYLFSRLGLKNYLTTIYSILFSILLIVLWWSGMYWNYANRMFHFVSEEKSKEKNSLRKNEIWKAAPQAVYRGINLPESTIQGIERLKKLEIVKHKKEKIKVLNMSELTALAHELPYTPATKLPLWYHLNIGMFDKQVKDISLQIKNHEYDLVLFEVIPSLDNFYPEKIQQELHQHYQQIDHFAAPRKEGNAHIEVFIAKK